MSQSSEFFSASFWEEVTELDELGRRAYAEYRTARDALFACFGQGGDASDVQRLWQRYCESAQVLDRMMIETQNFTGSESQGN